VGATLTPLPLGWLPWAFWTVSAIEVAAGLVLAARNGTNVVQFFANFLAALTLATLSFATIGALIATRRPSNRVGWLCCVAGVGLGSFWLQEYARYGLVTAPGAVPAAQVALWVNSWVWVFVLAAVAVYLPLLFPDGRLPSPRWQVLVWLGAVAATLMALSFALEPNPIDASQPQVSNLFSPPWAPLALPFLSPLASALAAVALFGGLAAIVTRFRRASGIERQQLEWFTLAIGLLVVALVGPLLLGLPNPTENTLMSGIAQSVALPAVPIATGIAILRHRLYDIDRLVGRTLVYGALSLCVVGVYAFLVAYLGMLFGAAGERSLPIALVATTVVALLFQPLRDWLQRAVNRLVYGDRADPDRALRRLGVRLEASLQPDEVLPAIVDTVQSALKLPYVAIAVARADAMEVVAERGAPRGDVACMPLVHGGERVGELRVCPHDRDEPPSAADRALLESLAQQAGAAVHGVQLTLELQRAREQLVLAREEERRRLRHDLHDELAPTLAALSLLAARAAERLEHDPSSAQPLVDELRAGLRRSVGDVRRLAHDLRPPVLDELGLVGALREWSGQLGGPLQVTVAADDVPPLPAAVEVAAYRIVLEAVMNALRHARARTCMVELAREGRALRIDVRDDGVGLDPTAGAGVGLRSMRERATELGGVCTIEAAPGGGTLVRARLPLTEATA
jgi:signal transduction histidine kinase